MPEKHIGKRIKAWRDEDNASTVKRLDWAGTNYALKAINEQEEDATAERWEAVAMLVLVQWYDAEGGETTVYRPDGIRPSQLLAMRGNPSTSINT